MVAAHLKAEGFEIVERNARVGRLEIDIIARRRDLVVFCEVRTRARADFGLPIESVDRSKLAKMRRAAAGWIRDNPSLRGCRFRIDAAGVLMMSGQEPELDYRADVG